MTVTDQNDERERLRLTADEFDMMLDEGILSPDEGAILHDGIVLVPIGQPSAFPPVSDPVPRGGTVPSDQVVAEAPVRHQSPDREVSAIMATARVSPLDGYVQRKYSVDEYYRMSEVGILPPGKRTELLNGEIILMAAIGSKHASCVDGFTDEFAVALSGRARTRIQNPISLNNHWELQPDIEVVRLASYADAHPRPRDVLLLIEVADTTVGYDRRYKLPAYARAGIPETWLADVNTQMVKVHTEPRHGVYTNEREVGLGGVLSPTAFPDVRIAVQDVFRW